MRNLISGYWDAIAGNRRRVLGAILLVGLGGAFEALGLASLVPALDQGSTSGKIAHFLKHFISGQRLTIELSIVGFAIFGLLAAITNMLSDRSLIRAHYAVESSLRSRVTAQILEMGWIPFLQLRQGDLNKAMILDGKQAGDGADRLARAVGLCLVLAMYFGLALFISIRLTAITAGFGLLCGLVYRRLSRIASAHATEQSKQADILMGTVGELVGSQKYFRAAGLQHQASKRVHELIERYRHVSVAANILRPVVRLFLEAGGVVLIAGYLALSLLVYKQTIGTAIIFLAVFYRIGPRFVTISEELYLARINYPWYESWREVLLHARAVLEAPGGDQRLPAIDVVTLQSVGFRYRPDAAPALAATNLEIHRGKCLAVVGPSGSGKTTLIDLLTGIIRPTTGDLLVEGVSLESLDQLWWRSQIGLVMQDSPMIGGSILDNVSLNSSNPDRAKVESCLRQADAWSFVSQMNEGIDSQVGDRGSRLSGGQRQRLALARALYRDPMLLLLDEATSSIDPLSEASILQAVRQVGKNCATVIVSHRLSTVIWADEIVFMESGHVLERGTWQELLAIDGRAAHLFRTQTYDNLDSEQTA